MLVLTDTDPAISSEDFLQFEEILGKKLPKSMMDFYLASGDILFRVWHLIHFINKKYLYLMSPIIIVLIWSIFIFCTVFLAAMLGSALFYLLSRRLVRRKIGFYGTATAFLLLVLTLCFAAIDRREAIDRTSAVVLRDAVAVKSSPDQNSTDLFILHEGTKVEISDRLNGWCEITIADGKKGWMECSTFETI